MPANEYQLRYNDPDGQILPLLWLGGSLLSLWFAVSAAVVITIAAWDLLVGLGVGVGGAILGIMATTLLAFVFPQLDARYLRLGPLAAAVEFLTMFVGAAVIVLLGLWALGVTTAEVVEPLPASLGTEPPAEQPVTPPEVATEDDGAFGLLRGLVRALSFVGLIAVLGGFLAKLLRRG